MPPEVKFWKACEARNGPETPTTPDGPRPTTPLGVWKSGTRGLFIGVNAEAPCQPTIRSL